ncbi:MAG: SRPBCC domain-containing protein [Ignavibacteriae bacterium]|nr:SRPBCC domain-containing protein [Ignavibacteriota bacterium]
MPSILHNFPISAPARKVFEVAATPAGLDTWWTLRSKGSPKLGETYEFWFGPEYDWRGLVTKYTPNKEIEWEMTVADKDWTKSRVGFEFEEKNGITHVRFHHTGWPEDNEHYRISSFCWAMYLRLMKRYIEFGEVVEYEKRLDV